MRKWVTLLLLLLTVWASVLCYGSGNTITIQGTGAPAGTCSYIMLYIDSATGNEYNCKSSAWNIIGGGGTGVTTTGTPANGNLTKFSSATSITNGDLSGDVTTTGTLATTLAATAVTAGSYISPSFTVDTKGRLTAAASNRGMVTSTYTNATTTPSNITGLSFSVSASTNYSMRCDLYYQGSAGTAGLDVAITGPASPTSVFYSYDEAATATSIQESVASAFATKLVGNATVTATTNLHAIVTMGLRNGSNAGTVQVQGSATGTGTVTVQAGSYCVWQ